MGMLSWDLNQLLQGPCESGDPKVHSLHGKCTPVPDIYYLDILAKEVNLSNKFSHMKHLSPS